MPRCGRHVALPGLSWPRKRTSSARVEDRVILCMALRNRRRTARRERWSRTRPGPRTRSKIAPGTIDQAARTARSALTDLDIDWPALSPRRSRYRARRAAPRAEVDRPRGRSEDFADHPDTSGGRTAPLRECGSTGARGAEKSPGSSADGGRRASFLGASSRRSRAADGCRGSRVLDPTHPRRAPLRRGVRTRRHGSVESCRRNSSRSRPPR